MADADLTTADDKTVQAAPDWMPEARGQAAQCWCDPENASTVMDVALAESMARRIAGWMDTAAMYARNADFYRGLVDECAQALGPAAYTADDGTVIDSPVRIKVPELVRALVAVNGLPAPAQQDKQD